MKICQTCNHTNPEEARFCQECGKTLSNTSLSCGVQASFCPTCGVALAQGAVFCAECGTALGRVCHQCKTANEADAKFCAGCGVPLPWVCKVCKHTNQANAVFCAHCGKEDKAKGVRAYINTWTVSAAAVIVLLLVWQGVAYYRFSHNVTSAYQLTDAKEFAMANNKIEIAEKSTYLFKNSSLNKIKDYTYQQKQTYRSSTQSSYASNSGSSSSSVSSHSNSSSNTTKPDVHRAADFNIYLKDNGFFGNTSIEKFTVKIQKTNHITGENYSMSPITKNVDGSVFLSNNYANFAYARVGYYTVECWGYNEWNKEVFHFKYENVLHKGKNTTWATFYPQNLPPTIRYQ